MTSLAGSGLLHTLLNPSALLSHLGAAATIGTIAIIFAETGLLLGFFLPGDSLLFIAGFYTRSSADSPVHLNLAVLLPGVAIAALLGAQTGYWIGQWAGERLFDKPDSRFFKRHYVERTTQVLEQYGEVKAVIFARFIPIVRTFMNPAVGVAGMPARRFLLANVVGGLVWSVGVTLLGVALGDSIKGNIDKYLLPVTLLIVLISLIPVFREVRKHRQASRGA